MFEPKAADSQSTWKLKAALAMFGVMLIGCLLFTAYLASALQSGSWWGLLMLGLIPLATLGFEPIFNKTMPESTAATAWHWAAWEHLLIVSFFMVTNLLDFFGWNLGIVGSLLGLLVLATFLVLMIGSVVWIFALIWHLIRHTKDQPIQHVLALIVNAAWFVGVAVQRNG